MQKKEENNVNFPFWKGLFFPINVICNQDLNELLCFFSLISALLVMLLGQSLSCTFGIEGRGVYCAKDLLSFVFLAVLLFVLAGVFVNRVWAIAFSGKSFADAIKIKVGMKDLKILGFLVSFLVALGVIGGGVYFLSSRIATPDLGMELIIFIAVSMLVIAALFFIINAVVFARFLDDQEWFVYRKTFWPTFDNIYKLIIWFLCYLLLLGYFVASVKKIFDASLNVLPLFWGNLLSQFVLQYVFYLMIIFFLSFLRYQEYYIFKEKTND